MMTGNRRKKTAINRETLMNELPLLMTALLAGLLGSGHCLGMCGSIAGGLGVLSGGAASPWGPVIRFNLARISSYALLGAALATVVGATGYAFDIPRWGKWMRIVSSLLILLIGLQFLFGTSILSFIERTGGRIWQRMKPDPARLERRSPAWRQWLIGMSWGFLPCGLVYTLLLTAASTANALKGALVMFVFGIGTLPSMVGVSAFSGALAQVRSAPAIRRMIGAGLVLLAAWSFILAMESGGAHAFHG